MLLEFLVRFWYRVWIGRSFLNPMIPMSFVRQFQYWLYAIIISRTRFQSESRLYSFLYVKELLARNRRNIWSLSDSNGIRIHNHLVRKRTLSLDKWLIVSLRTKWLRVRISLLPISILFSMTFKTISWPHVKKNYLKLQLKARRGNK